MYAIFKKLLETLGTSQLLDNIGRVKSQKPFQNRNYKESYITHRAVFRPLTKI